MIERILQLMDEQGIKGNKLTSELGLSSSAISEWKKGKGKPSTDAVVKIAKYFHVSTDYILGVDEQKKPAPTNGGELDPELADLISRIPAHRMPEVQQYLRYLIACEGKP